jgi:hypothetical protein
LRFPVPHAPMAGGPASAEHRLTMERGEVAAFVAS